ncbi:AAA family ATPase [Vibrio gangliei]|uniref:AAA family ATPase n=1 Tax=Vibrio gangliei TaxID=2077090 RepID=UPI000D01D67A|nr:AAA family ATPase [Vibrio gangliei]
MFDTQTVEQFAQVLAKTLVTEQAKANRAEAAKFLGYQGTSNKQTIEKVSANSLFEILDEPFNESVNIKVRKWSLPHVAVPSIKENYFFRKDLLVEVNALVLQPRKYGLFLTGKKGTGKSSIIEQYCARTGLPLYQETGSSTTEYLDLFGTTLPTVSGSIKFLAGKLFTAIKEGGIYLLDEIDMMSAGELVKLNELFTADKIYVPQIEEWVNVHKDFRFVATGNTNGSGLSGSYVGANVLNEAFMDRFYVIDVPYMTKELEQKFMESVVSDIEQKYGLAKNKSYQNKRAGVLPLASQMVEVARAIRTSAEQQDLPVLSLRGLERWIFKYLTGKSILDSFKIAYANTLDEPTKEAVVEILTTHIPTVQAA